MGTMSLNYGGGDSNWIGNQGVHEGGGTYITNILSFGTHNKSNEDVGGHYKE